MILFNIFEFRLLSNITLKFTHQKFNIFLKENHRCTINNITIPKASYRRA